MKVTSAKSPLTGHFLGSISEEVLGVVTQPVLLVGPLVPADFTMTRPTAVLCVDETDVAEAAVPTIAAWVRTFGGAQPWVTEVVPTGAASTPPDGHESSHVRHFAERLADEGVIASWDVLQGGEPEVWLEDFGDRVTDPVFVATSVRWTDGRLHWHSTTRRLVQRSTRPVLVVPAGHGRSDCEPPDRPPLLPDGVEELAPAACWDLLRSIRVGRLAVCWHRRPLSFPVNYVVDGSSVVFRTAAGTKLAAARDYDVAFEIDDFDERWQLASSVIIAGGAVEITRYDEWDRAFGLPLFPWDVAPKSHFVRIVPESVSGRRFAPSTPVRAANGQGAEAASPGENLEGEVPPMATAEVVVDIVRLPRPRDVVPAADDE